MGSIPKSQKTVLDNGLTIITERIHSVRSAAFGIFVGSGSSSEDATEAGISHFLEHMNFKGTPTRTAFQIAEEFDAVGGKINAYTSKEYTCFYGITLDRHIQTAISVISDLFLNSLYDPDEIELEKGVVLEEIKMYQDAPDELVHDIFLKTILSGHPLGESVIGTKKSVSNLKRKDILSYQKRFYTPNNIIISAAGNIWHRSFVKKIETVFKNWEGSAKELKSIQPKLNKVTKVVSKKIEQAHLCLGTKSPSQLDDDRYAFVLLDNILGGSMTSRLFQEIREKRGLAYALFSTIAPFKDCGVFYTYVGCDKENVAQVIDLILTELRNILKEGITKKELKRAKEFVKGTLVLGLETPSSRMNWMMRSEFYYKKMITIADVFKAIDRVTVDDIIRVANKYIADKYLTLVLLGDLKTSPVKELKF